MTIGTLLKSTVIVLPFSLLTSGVYASDCFKGEATAMVLPSARESGPQQQGAQDWQVAQSSSGQEQQTGEGEDMPSTQHQREVIEDDGEGGQSGQGQGQQTGGQGEMPSSPHQREVIEEGEESGQQ